MTRPNQGLSSLAKGGKVRDPGYEVAICRYPFIHLIGVRHGESKVSCARTQHNVPGQPV